MQTIFSHLTRIIETSDRPKREAKKVRLLVAQLDLAFEDTEAMARQTFDLNWEILMSLLKIFEKHP